MILWDLLGICLIAEFLSINFFDDNAEEVKINKKCYLSGS